MNTYRDRLVSSRNVKALLFLAVAFTGSYASAQSDLFPKMDAGANFDAGADRAVERQFLGSTEYQRTCPQQTGDAYDLTSEYAWNVLELGVQVQPEQKPKPKLQAYTRYTCMKPLDRP